MADLVSRISDMENLRCRAARLVETALSLISIFTQEANRLNRNDEASRLKALRYLIEHQLDELRRSESLAEYGHVHREMLSTLGEVALSEIITRVSKNKQLSTLTNSLSRNYPAQEPPFGKVLIRIGSRGLPDDVKTVCVSRLARESNRKEPEIIKELQERGYLLFSEKAFLLLIDNLVNDIHEGRRRLPVSLEILSEIISSGSSELESGGSE
jgi:hypothetical protein